ncbi:MAG: hypothetical protein F6J90_24380 [Moorea sp. SIOASIH]|uniref:hypothetical protein n=1 Tax=Moorena sp. SIOASIH TaxID=2607817 RepID=UPI0013BA9343|nr:hypothetical protein [Moorena sp. SIOASIH]NEO39302.1 hypothetical protein [Moorena sp. SIOASIH]
MATLRERIISNALGKTDSSYHSYEVTIFFPCSLLPTPYSLLPAPYSLKPRKTSPNL